MASNRTDETFIICIKQNGISKVSGRHAKAGSFQKGIMKYYCISELISRTTDLIIFNSLVQYHLHAVIRYLAIPVSFGVMVPHGFYHPDHKRPPLDPFLELFLLDLCLRRLCGLSI